MRKTYFNYILKYIPLFKEKYLIFDIDKATEKAIENVLNVAAKLFETINTITERTVDALDYSGAFLGKGIDWVGNKITGKLLDLQEYQFLPNHFQDTNSVIGNYPALSNNSDIRDIIKFHTRIAFLNLRIAQIKKFIEPALSQFQLVERRYNQIKELRQSKKRSEAQESAAKIENLEKSIKRSGATKNDPGLAQERWELQQEKSKFEILKAELAIQTIDELNMDTAVIEWSSVFLHTTQFPPLYGSTVDRVVVRDSDKKKTDLNELYKYLESYLEPYKKDLEKYSEEIDKLKYYRNKLIATATKDLKSEDSDKREKAEKLKEELDKALGSINNQLDTGKSVVNSPDYYPYTGSSKNIYGIHPTPFEKRGGKGGYIDPRIKW